MHLILFVGLTVEAQYKPWGYIHLCFIGIPLYHGSYQFNICACIGLLWEGMHDNLGTPLLSADKGFQMQYQ